MCRHGGMHALASWALTPPANTPAPAQPGACSGSAEGHEAGGVSHHCTGSRRRRARTTTTVRFAAAAKCTSSTAVLLASSTPTRSPLARPRACIAPARRTARTYSCRYVSGGAAGAASETTASRLGVRYADCEGARQRGAHRSQDPLRGRQVPRLRCSAGAAARTWYSHAKTSV